MKTTREIMLKVACISQVKCKGCLVRILEGCLILVEKETKGN